jgi:hypothetical protein
LSTSGSGGHGQLSIALGPLTLCLFLCFALDALALTRLALLTLARLARGPLACSPLVISNLLCTPVDTRAVFPVKGSEVLLKGRWDTLARCETVRSNHEPRSIFGFGHIVDFASLSFELLVAVLPEALPLCSFVV